eukprot:CAMPEP_0204153084 /NCGR_PEP_ID=MMETSP0361-20130328/27559_1 /ASSEMBLY_ACC=CAM_ASM_000343 /TAXON_ID=268821 /ORGANISM="Scrippsiella Hangoei, Strain SHTV-5" /LENGTH=95 /DNA_ID=CAMNT_0051108153 /DNA_START=84 /DNA_END=366 /DNA_ORIENTATION=+
MVAQFSLGLPPSQSAVPLPRWPPSPAAAASVLGGSAPALPWPRGAQRSIGASASAPASASALARAALGEHGGGAARAMAWRARRWPSALGAAAPG